MLETFNTSAFEYEKLSQEEMESRGILGRLVGVIADFKNPTRNQRKYEEVLWDRTFDDPIVKEKIENRCLYGELGHPEDRIETDMSKICICLAEQPKKSDDGKLYGVFDVLDTPNGRILKTLLDYGTSIGVSSRGEGDIISDGFLGEDIVDPDTYQFECFDAVLLPAVKAARLTAVTESLHNGKTLKQALVEDLNNCNEKDKEVMKDTLNSLDINLDEELTYKGYKVTLDNSGVVLSSKEGDKSFSSLDDAISFADKTPITEDLDEESSEDSSITKDVEIEKESEKEEADNDGDDLVVELQEQIQKNSDLEKLVKSLQEKLSVCYAKEKKNEGQINTFRSSIKSLQESVKKVVPLESKVKSLEEELNSSKQEIDSKTKKIEKLTERLADIKSQHNEKVKVASEMIVELNNKVESLNEEIQKVKTSKSASISTLKESYAKKETSLTEKLVSLQKDSKLREAQLQEKLNKSNSEIERLKGIAQKAIDKYIVEKCVALGIDSQDVKNRLGKSYSFNDINRICESLSNSKIAIDNLPFKSSRVSRIQVSESMEKPMIKNLDNSGDTIDSQLLNMIDRLS